MPNPPHVVAVDAVPKEIIAGKAFGWAWEIAESVAGPADDLSEYGCAELSTSRSVGQGAYVWTTTSGQLAFVNDQIVLWLTSAETEAMTRGDWSFLLSVGTDTESDIVVARGFFKVTSRP